jgi:hypothetical protein
VCTTSLLAGIEWIFHRFGVGTEVTHPIAATDDWRAGVDAVRSSVNFAGNNQGEGTR